MICTSCHKPILPDQDRATVGTREYHSACFDRHQEHDPSTATEVARIKAKIASGVLPRQVDDVAIRFARYAVGICVGCDGAFRTNDVGVQFHGEGGRRFLHPDCYVLWTEACGG